MHTSRRQAPRASTHAAMLVVMLCPGLQTGTGLASGATPMHQGQPSPLGEEAAPSSWLRGPGSVHSTHARVQARFAAGSP